MSTAIPSNLWQAFEQVATSQPDATALVCDGQVLSFAELRAQAERCAQWLHDRTIQRGEIVALQLTKRPATYALWLACLRQGVIYVFVDPANPVERTRKILERVRPALMITRGDEASVASGKTAVLAEVEAALATRHPDATGNVVAPAQVHGLSPAYIMFTSGSTGEPKGAVIAHQGVLSLMAWVRSCVGGVSGHRFSNLNPLHFDNAVFDLYGGLLNGATLVPVETGQSHNPLTWVKQLRASRVSVMFAVPTLYLTLIQLRLLTRASLPSVAFFLFGGEGFPIEALRQFHSQFASQARLINVYGPTETSCICSSVEINPAALDAAGTGFASLGRMHPDFEHIVVGDAGALCGPGESGELWIGGANVGLGYFRNPAETEQKFVQDPRQSHYRSVWYRSGDLVQQDADGLLWFRGRADNQVKVRGHRIELEEIDLAVESFPGISRAVAAVCAGRDGPEIRLAFSAGPPVDLAALQAWCMARLPKYMQPARLVPLAEIPQNANGKADRRAVARLLDAATGSSP